MTNHENPTAAAGAPFEQRWTGFVQAHDNGGFVAVGDHMDAMAEIERLTAALVKSRDALEKLQSWASAYPLKVFPEPDFERAHELLTAGGMTLDAISASNMRHVITQTLAIVDAGLQA